MARRPAVAPGQLAFCFEPPPGPAEEGGLAGVDRQIAGAVSKVLKEDSRSRYEIAGCMSAMLDAEVSKSMLDAYSAEAREAHNISLARFLALIACTQRFDVLNDLCRPIGCTVLVGDEVATLELGHVEAEMERLKARRDILKRRAPSIARGAAA
jgi:hypothetical protein